MYIDSSSRFSPQTYSDPMEWTYQISAGHAPADGCFPVLSIASSPGDEGRFDDIAFRELNLKSLLAFLPDISAKTFLLKASGDTYNTGSLYGIATCWDSDKIPLNGLLAYRTYDNVEGTVTRLDECVNGVWTNLFNVPGPSATCGAVGIIIDGKSVKLFYNNVQVGAVEILYNPAMLDGQYHGLFSTDTSPLYSLSLTPVTTPTKISFLGDNITDPTITRYASMTSNLYPKLVIPQNHGVGGSVIVYDGTHVDLEDQVKAAARDDADIIIIELGTNDSYGADITTIYETQVQVLQAGNPKAKIYALGILPRSSMAGVADKNSKIETACTKTGITYIDTTDWINPATDLYDGLHPNDTGSLKMPTGSWIYCPEKESGHISSIIDWPGSGHHL